MQKVGHAVPQVDVCHVKSSTDDPQHGVRALRLHTTGGHTIYAGFNRNWWQKAEPRSVLMMSSLECGVASMASRTFLVLFFWKRIYGRKKSANLHLLRDEPVQPAGVNAVVLEAFRLQQLNEVLHRGPEVSSDGQLFQSHHHVAGKDDGTAIYYINHKFT